MELSRKFCVHISSALHVTTKRERIVRKLKKVIVATFFLNIGSFLLFSGCYSSLHQGQVIDGPNMAFALRPLHRGFLSGFSMQGAEELDAKVSIALRYGWASSGKRNEGHSFGLLFDLVDSSGALPDEWHVGPPKPYSFFGIRGDYYCQIWHIPFTFPKNFFLDGGIGVEFPSNPPPPGIPYVVISGDLSSHFTLYGEARTGMGIGGIVSTFGAKFEVSKFFSLFSEVNIFKHYDTNCSLRLLDIGAGIMLRAH